MNLARRDSTLARVLPVVLAKNKDTLDFPRLEFLARKLEVQKAIDIAKKC